MERESWQAAFAVDRDVLLQRVRKRPGARSFEVPAQALERAIEEAGYRVRWRGQVPAGELSFCDFDRREIVLPADFARRLRHPAVAREARTSTLAHELAHARLHEPSGRMGEQRRHWEEQAMCYARVFLVPKQLLKFSFELQCLLLSRGSSQSVLWGYVLRMARHFRVSGAFMAAALQGYGLLRLEERSRWLEVESTRPHWLYPVLHGPPGPPERMVCSG